MQSSCSNSEDPLLKEQGVKSWNLLYSENIDQSAYILFWEEGTTLISFRDT